jgi:hypothetical protein
VSLRRAATAASTIVVAVVCALAVPVSQLRTITVVAKCCCPDPSNCHCPDHKPDRSGCPAMRACHRWSHEVVAPEAPSFTPEQVAIAIAPIRATAAVLAAPHGPKAAPSPDEPYGPS